MRILLIHRYFWPDSPPYASMLRAMGKHFAERGHEVTVLTTQPSYTAATAKLRQPKTEMLDGMRVIRRPMFPESKRNWVARLLNVALFQLHLKLHLLFRRRAYHLVTATTMPPVVVAGVVSTFARLRGSRMLYHCMDLYPEIARISGGLPMGKGPLPALLGAWDRRTCKKAWRVVVLSEDMKRTIAARGISTENVRVLNNFSLDAAPDPESQTEPTPKQPDEFRVLFAGNIGRFQGLETVLEAAQKLREHTKIQFHFLGDGAARTALTEQAGELLGKTMHFHGFQALPTALAFMRSAELGIVSLQPKVIHSAFPSKTMTYLAEGLPLLAMVERDSSLAQLVEEHRVGATVGQGDARALADAILQIAEAPQAHAEMRKHARELSEAEFVPAAALAKWDQLLGELEAELSAR
jgi:glycosyltransferase involved in cell wall biosynthesis